jgi:Na+/H+-dicarboxylate symporter
MVLLLTSKGSAGVAGAGFVTLAATLGAMHQIPPAGLVLLLGVEQFTNAARAVVNIIGNGVATIVIAKWEHAFDERRADLIFNCDALNSEVPAPGTSLSDPSEPMLDPLK